MIRGHETELQTGLTDEQILTLRGLRRVNVKPSAWGIWKDAMPDNTVAVDVAVANVLFDDDGEPVAFGVRRSEMMRTIKETGGDLTTAPGILVAIEPERISLFSTDGTTIYDSQNK